MKFSFFTPTHRPTHIGEVFSSILRQRGEYNWEWIILLNGDVLVDDIPEDVRSHKNVKIFKASADLRGIGALKGYACSLCNGDVLVEIDHDDLLASNACLEISKAYSIEPAGFYYSDFVNVKDSGKCETYNVRFGWGFYDCIIDGKEYTACRAFPATARSLCYIYYAPNHVRAWSRSAYIASGGYDSRLVIGDDHDLLCRTYLAGIPFIWIDKPLYIYRRWKDNSFVKFQTDIQKQQKLTCDKYLHKLIQEECRRSGTIMLDLSPFSTASENFIRHNIFKTGFKSLSDEFSSNSVGCVQIVDGLNYVPRNIISYLITEIYTILRPGGWLITSTPSITDSEGRLCRFAFGNPSAQSYWSEDSFSYFCEKRYADKLIMYKGRFQKVRLYTDDIPYVYADLCALKYQRQPGEVFI